MVANKIIMRHGSLFSGIGGFDLAAEWMGWENIFHCEWNKFGQQVLKYYWPKAISYEDITKTDFTIHRGRIDIITGGFPCQPYSSAGKRLGKEDERHLWPEMLRAIREIQPSWVVGENVRGLTNWNGGMVFDEVQAELEAQGYEVLPFLLPACAVNAPHRRDRIWFVANAISTSKRANEHGSIRPTNAEIGREGSHTILNAIRSNGFKGDVTNPNRNGLNKCNSDNEVDTIEGRVNAFGDFNEGNGDGDAADTECTRLEHRYKTRDLRSKETKASREGGKFTNEFATNGNGKWDITNTDGIGLRRESNGIGESGLFSKKSERNYWEKFPTVSPICIGDDGLSNRLDNITFPKWRQESIKAGGNAIVPQVVHQIFKAIEEYERESTPNTD
jgi:DNA (cytosine-5)-methyltransferase 1